MLFLFQTTNLFNVRDLQLIAPELILTVVACVALVMEVILPYKFSKWSAWFSLVGIALALVSLGAQFVGMGGTFNLAALQSVTAVDGFYGMVRIDGFALVFKAIFLVAAALAIAISTRYLDIEREQHGEYYALVLFATVGMMFLGSGYDLISLYIALELMAVTFTCWWRSRNAKSVRMKEPAWKYFLLGEHFLKTSGGILLYGMSFSYTASRVRRTWVRYWTGHFHRRPRTEADVAAGNDRPGGRIVLQGCGRSISHVGAGCL